MPNARYPKMYDPRYSEYKAKQSNQMKISLFHAYVYFVLNGFRRETKQHLLRLQFKYLYMLAFLCNMHSVLYIEWEISNSKDPDEMRGISSGSALFAIMKIIFCKLNSFEIKCQNKPLIMDNRLSQHDTMMKMGCSICHKWDKQVLRVIDCISV